MTRTTNEVHARPIHSPAPHPVYDGPHEELFDWHKVQGYALFSLGSVRRRPLLFLSVFATMILLAVVALVVLPKTYEVQSRLLAQKNPVLAVRADSNQMEPTRAAAETIIGRDNLRSLIQQTDLLQEWTKHRAPILRWKDWLLRALNRAPTEEELTKGLTLLLEKNLTVWTTPDGTVAIQVRWRDPLMAYRLVDAAQQNFLEKRHVLEISTIVEQISILEGHASGLKKEIETQVAELQRLRDNFAPKSARAAPPPPPAKMVDPEQRNLRVMLNAKRRVITDLEEFRQRHLVELQTRLTEQRAIYSENHPIVVDLQRSIELLRHQSPQVVMLRQEEADLRRQLANYSEGAEGVAPGAANIPAELFRDLSGSEDSSVEYAGSQLRYAAAQYASLRERIDAARIDLDTARAAFKYRYSVVVPPEIPGSPIKPKATLVIMAALVAGLFLALFATTAADLLSGVVLERWQLEDLLPPSQAILGVPWRAAGQLPPAGAPEP